MTERFIAAEPPLLSPAIASPTNLELDRVSQELTYTYSADQISLFPLSPPGEITRRSIFNSLAEVTTRAGATAPYSSSSEFGSVSNELVGESPESGGPSPVSGRPTYNCPRCGKEFLRPTELKYVLKSICFPLVTVCAFSRLASDFTLLVNIASVMNGPTSAVSPTAGPLGFLAVKILHGMLRVATEV